MAYTSLVDMIMGSMGGSKARRGSKGSKAPIDRSFIQENFIFEEKRKQIIAGCQARFKEAQTKSSEKFYENWGTKQAKSTGHGKFIAGKGYPSHVGMFAAPGSGVSYSYPKEDFQRTNDYMKCVREGMERLRQDREKMFRVKRFSEVK